MLKRYSVRNLDQDAIDMLADLKTEERRELGAILEDCIYSYWSEIFVVEELTETSQNRAA